MAWSSPLLLESGNGGKEDDPKIERVGDKGLSRKRQSLSNKPQREDGEGVARGGTAGGW